MKRYAKRVAAGLAALTALLAVTAACLIWRQGAPKAMPARSAAVAAEAADPLTAYRTRREQLNQRQRAELNDIIHDPDTDAAALDLAQRRLMTLQAAETDATQIEAVLKARGFEDAVAMIGPGAVTILIRAEALTRAQTAVILDLVLRQTGVSGGNVKIIPIN